MGLTNEHLDEYEFYLPRECIPLGWEIVSLDDVSFIVTDGTHMTPKYKAKGVRFISIKNIRPYQPINWNSYEKYISRHEHNTLIKRCYPKRDDILFPRIGTLGFAKRIDFDEEISIFVGLGLIKPVKKQILPKYLEYYMNTPYIDRLSVKRAKGTGRKTLPLGESRRFPCPLAPLAEQKRIVAKIDELFSALDKGVESLKTVREQLKVYHQAVLKHAFEGRLTQQWREANKHKLETPEQLFTWIRTERDKSYQRRIEEWNAAVRTWKSEKKRGKKPLKPKPFKPVEQLPTIKLKQLPILPESWQWVSLSCLVSVEKKPMTTGPFGTVLKKHEHEKSGIPVLGIENIGEGRFIPGNKIFVSDEKAEVLGSFEVEPGELIISRSGTVGEICIVPEGLGKTLISSNLIRVSLNQNIILSSLFVFMFQRGGAVRSQVKELCKGSSREFLNQSILQSLVFPICSPQEQLQIIKEIDEKLSLTEQLSKSIDSELVKSSSLRQSILNKAFSGQLIQQDPDDEPAFELLLRLKEAKTKREIANAKMRKIKTGKKII